MKSNDIIFTIREISADEKTRYEAEMREKAIMDERSALTNSERRGFKKGIEEGRAIGIEEGKSIGIEEGSLKKAVEIVYNLVSNMGFDLESALKAANISEEQYNEYKRK